MENIKLYTEDEVKKAIELAREDDIDWLDNHYYHYDEEQIIAKLTPFETPH